MKPWCGWLWIGLSFVMAPAVADELPETSKAKSPATVKSDIENEAADDYELMRLFVDAVDAVEQNYVAPISRRELMEAAIQGVLSKLDNYSNYIAPEDMSDFQKEVIQEFGGIGIQIDVAGDGQIEVVSPLNNTPASRAGLQAGDLVTHVAGQPTQGIGVTEAVRRMKGPVGSDVALTIARAGESFDVTLTRETVQIETVLGARRRADGSWDYWLDEQEKIGYLRITSFGAQTADDVTDAMQQLSDPKLRGLVLDLRNNPGGLLSAAIEISDTFLDRGLIVTAVGRNVPETSWEAKPDGAYVSFPMVVLVNRFSASGSEIVAACLQDHGRAAVCGERTWGKGSVQRLMMLEDGKSALKLTTSTYQRPSGKNIHRAPGASEEEQWGVSPNESLQVGLDRGQARELMLYRAEAFRIRPAAQAALPLFMDDQITAAVDRVRQQLD